MAFTTSQGIKQGTFQIDAGASSYQKLGIQLVSLIPFSIGEILGKGLDFLAGKINTAEINRKAATLSKFGVDTGPFNAKVGYIVQSIVLYTSKQNEILQCEERAVEGWWEKLNKVVSSVCAAVENKLVKSYKVRESLQYKLGHIEAQKMLEEMIYTGKADVVELDTISVCQMLSVYVCESVHEYRLGPEGKGAIVALA